MPRRLVAALLASSVLGGCAYSLSGPSPNRQRNEPPECDTSKSLVVIDGLMATALGVAGLSIASTDEPAVALLPLAIGAIYLGGAIKGNTAVNKCRAATSEYGGAEVARNTLSTMDAQADAGETARRPSDVVPQLPYQPTPYPGQAAYSPTQQPPYASPAPAKTPPAQAAPPPHSSAAGDEDWSDFWREVP
jgi:hypothetical protein